MPTSADQDQNTLTAPTRKRPRQGPDTLRVIFAILVVLLLTVLLAGALGFSMQDAS